jgi:hypothetical protein
MKLLYCLQCGDIFNLGLVVKTCSCGSTKGVYKEDRLHAVYSGEYAVPLGFSNPSMMRALRHWKDTGTNPDFTAFFLPVNCTTMIQEK